MVKNFFSVLKGEKDTKNTHILSSFFPRMEKNHHLADNISPNIAARRNAWQFYRGN
jgi:hypothetical protein